MRQARAASGVIITPGLDAGVIRSEAVTKRRPLRLRLRAVGALGVVIIAFMAVAGQLVRLASIGQTEVRSSMSMPIATAFSRPDLVDRNGRLLATDIVMPSLFADPALVLDRDEVAEKLSRIFPDIDPDRVRADLADRDKRFVWLKRGISPAVAQEVFNLGLPGLAFRQELKRAYPAGRVAGSVLGSVNVDNKGLSGLERHLDDTDNVEPVHAASLTKRAPLRLSLDLGVQHAVEDELRLAMERYQAKAATGVVMDVHTGEVVAAASLPSVDPLDPTTFTDAARRDRLAGGVYELGSVFKLLTVGVALDTGTVTLGSMIDVSQPLEADGHTIEDHYQQWKPLSVADVFVKSSNVGSGALGLAVGSVRQQAFLRRLGLTEGLVTEAGPVAAPKLPKRWKDIETVTVSYGHGIAVAPLQFAAAAAAMVNGGTKVTPTFLRKSALEVTPGPRVIKPQTSTKLRHLMRRNVVARHGTGKRADVPGLEVGGKTGTAEMPGAGGYKEKSVIASFFGAFPMSDPKYVTFVSLFEPEPTTAAGRHVVAGRNAAPTTAAIVQRIAPLLGVRPRTDR